MSETSAAVPTKLANVGVVVRDQFFFDKSALDKFSVVVFTTKYVTFILDKAGCWKTSLPILEKVH